MSYASFASDLSAHVAWTRALARQLVRDGAEAEDVAQETLLRALEHPPRDPGALRGFLRRVLGNVRSERARGAERRAARERVVARAEVQPAADELAERLAWQRRLVQAVERLEEPFRSAVLLRFFERLPPRAIAARLGVPVKTVDSRLQRGLERLRADLDREKGGRRSWALALCALLESDPEPAAPGVRAPLWVFAAGALAAALVSGRRLWRPEPAVGELSVLASAERGESESAARAGAAPAARREPVVSSAALAERVTGCVLGPDGAPLAGARVELFEPPLLGFEVRREAFRDLEPRLAQSVTAADGSFAFEAPAGAPLLVRAGAEGLGSEELTDVHAGDRIELRLEPAGRFVVETRRAQEPCGGAVIELTRQGNAAPAWRGVTDDLGRAEANGLTRGIYTVECSPLDGTRDFVLDVALAPQGEASAAFLVDPGRELGGVVRAALGGRPLSSAAAGVRVKGPRSGPVETDANGAFRLRGLPAGLPDWTVEVEAEGFAPARQRIRAAEAPAEVSIELGPELRLSGTLVDPSGAAVGGAWISCGARGAQSDGQGRFELGGLVPGSDLVVRVRARGRATWVGTSSAPAGEARRDIGRIALAPAVSLAGRVQTSAGRALGGASVELSRISPPDGVASPVASETAGSTTIAIVAARAASAPPADRELALELERAGSRWARTSAAGSFRIDDLSPGRYRLLARANGYEPVPPREIELAAAGREDEVELVFEEGLSLAGIVRGSDGVPLANAWLVVRGPGLAGGGPVQLSALDGRFTLRGVPAEPVELEVSYHQADGQGEHLYLRRICRGLVAPLADLEVVLPRNRPIEGRVVDEAGRPLAGFLVRAADEEGRVLTAASDAEGRFRVGAAEGTAVDLELGGPAARDPEEARAAAAKRRYEAHRARVPAGSTGIELCAVPRP